MSGIYIPNIKEPKDCDHCIYKDWSNFNQFYVCDAVQRGNPILFDGKETKSVAVMRNGRADNCPLVPVPDHGRLIDADALDDVLLKLADNEYSPKVFASWLTYEENAPTIIPADKDGAE